MLTFAFILFVVITAGSFAATLMPTETSGSSFPRPMNSMTEADE